MVLCMFTQEVQDLADNSEKGGGLESDCQWRTIETMWRKQVSLSFKHQQKEDTVRRQRDYWEKGFKAADVTQPLPDAERGAGKLQLRETNGRGRVSEAAHTVIITTAMTIYPKNAW